MDTKGLLFIPDISGFTKFVNQTAIEHSKHIIEELLDTIINANRLGLQVSEIEGDAILFYKFGEAPPLKELRDQVEAMFIAFHRHLKNYETRRICNCGACCTAVNLTLKFISHAGEFTGYQVKDFYKLLGKDVILAHQLLKNDIPEHEYWLATDSLFSPVKVNGDLINWQQGEKKSDEDVIPFHYTMLSALKEKVKAEPPPDVLIKSKIVKVIESDADIDADINTVFNTITDTSLRPKFVAGVLAVDQESHKINRLGAQHRCVLQKETNVLITSGISRSPEKITLSETNDKKTMHCNYILDRIHENKTHIKTEYFIKKNPIVQLVFSLFVKKKLTAVLAESNKNLNELCRKRMLQPAPL